MVVWYFCFIIIVVVTMTENAAPVAVGGVGGNDREEHPKIILYHYVGFLPLFLAVILIMELLQ